jgi:hypothetical protein
MKLVAFSACVLAATTLSLSSAAEVYGRLSFVPEGRSLTPGSVDPTIARWLLTLPRDDISIEREQARIQTPAIWPNGANPEASVQQMLQPEFIKGGHYRLALASPAQPVAEKAEGRSVAEQPARTVHRVRNPKVAVNHERCACSKKSALRSSTRRLHYYGELNSPTIADVFEKGPFLLLDELRQSSSLRSRRL